jgi:hypothetical protein
MTEKSPRRAARMAAWAWIVGLTLAMTLLNAVKPLHMDDSVYHNYASWIAEHPDDPYGGEVVVWWALPRSGMEMLAPVFLPYLWSRAILVHGDDVFLQKLWLAPFLLALVASSWALARRFARGLEPAIVLMVAFSPAILPSVNFMLDVPALALGLAGLVVFARASDRRCLSMAVAAGLIAGAAINTKWTGMLAPATIGLYALTHRRIGLGVAAIIAAGLVFVGWEAWIALLYGQSHFLTWYAKREGSILGRIAGMRALVAILGGVAPAVLMLGLAGLRRRRLALVVAGLSVASLAGLAIGLDPQAVFLPMGVLILLDLGAVSWVLLKRSAPSTRRGWRPDRGALFLLLWVGLEVAGVLMLSPFSAVRRVVGLVVAATLLAGRLASRTCRTPARSAAVRGIALAGAALGLFFFGVDLREACVERSAARAAAREAFDLRAPGHTAWFVGRWGFRHYATREGLTPIRVGRTELRRGDVLVVEEEKLAEEAKVEIDPALIDEVLTLRYDDAVPFRTHPPFYAGKDPIQGRSGPRFVVHVYRVVSPFTPLGWILPEYGPQDRPVGAIRTRRVLR